MNNRMQADLRERTDKWLAAGYSVVRCIDGTTRDPFTIRRGVTRKIFNGLKFVDAPEFELAEKENKGTVISAPAPEVFKWNLRSFD